MDQGQFVPATGDAQVGCCTRLVATRSARHPTPQIPLASDARRTRDYARELVAVWCSHKAASFVVVAAPPDLTSESLPTCIRYTNGPFPPRSLIAMYRAVLGTV